MSKLTRRTFLAGGAALGGGLLVAYVATPNRLAIHGRPDPGCRFLTTWIEIAEDGRITVLVPHVEMGQGVHTALAMMAADELDADWSQVRVRQAPAEDAYAIGEMVRGFVLGNVPFPRALEGRLDYAAFKIADLMDVQTTGGSASVRFTGELGMRRAGAAARMMLIRAAAASWDVAASTCRTSNSRVFHDATGRAVEYGALAARAAATAPPRAPVLKQRAEHTICGKSIARFDLPGLVDGSTLYAMDFTLPGMLYAAIRHAPVFGGNVVSYDDTEIVKRPGIHKIVKLHRAIAVTADSYWRAHGALAALPVEFDNGPHAGFSSIKLDSDFQRALRTKHPSNDFSSGRPRAVLEHAESVHETVYRAPFLAHAAMEPLNCTAHYRDGRLEIWAGTQDPLAARAAAADACGFKQSQVTVHPMPLGGAFGRRLPNGLDFVREAATLAVAVSRPVKLIWSREQDIQHDRYRPATYSRFRAVLGPDGYPSVWDNVFTDMGFNEGRTAALPPYAIPNLQIGRVACESPVPLGYWRSVEHSYQGFFIESFVDELACSAGRDPLQFRLDLLRKKPRYQAVLRKAADMIGWGRVPGFGRGMGIAVKECFQTIVAEAAEVGVDDAGVLSVYRICAAVDAGEIVNPQIARAQVEGGIVFGLSAALYGKITIDQGRVVQSNFPNYPMIRLKDAPEIEVQFVQSDQPPGGMGEVGVPTVAPAVANAVYAATGARVRSLPLVDLDLHGRRAGSGACDA